MKEIQYYRYLIAEVQSNPVVTKRAFIEEKQLAEAGEKE
jgi:hypothetical protein